MSEQYSVEGEIKIYPPLSYAETKDWPVIIKAAGVRGLAPLYIDVQETKTENDKGYATVVTGTGLKYSGDGRAEYIEDVVQAAVAHWGQHHTFDGHFEIQGGDNYHWRVVINRNGKSQTIQPIITWPVV